MHHIMFDVDGTLVQSFEFDEACFIAAVKSVLGDNLDTQWHLYPHVTDSGILDHHLKRVGLMHQRDQWHKKVKQAFINNISDHLSQQPAQEVAGAGKLISHLKSMPNVSLSIATGGWGETARLKLASAGIDIEGIPLASANDHVDRAEIMRCALNKAGVSLQALKSVTYVGDAQWDIDTCKRLKWPLILVGERAVHNKRVANFDELAEFMDLLEPIVNG